MITRIEAYNYRCFPKLSLGLGDYHVLAGANGAGKTTLLDIPVLLGDLLRERRVTDAVLRRLGERRTARAHRPIELLHRGQGETVDFALEARLPDDVAAELAEDSLPSLDNPLPTHLRYELRLTVQSQRIEVGAEYLFLFTGPKPDGSVIPGAHQPRPGEWGQGAPDQGSGTLAHPDWQSVIARNGLAYSRLTPETTATAPQLPAFKVPVDQLALEAVLPDPSLFPAALWLRSFLKDGTVFYDPDWERLREAAPPGDELAVRPDARNTPWLALHLYETDPRRHRDWVDHVRTALPQVEDIGVRVREEDRRAYFTVAYRGGHKVTSSGLSDGTLRVLALTLLPYLPRDAVPSLAVTEEPENGIHPRAIETVVQSLSSLYGSQVWVSTHSPLVLAHTELDQVLAARIRKDGAVEVLPGTEHPRMKNWKGTVDGLDLGTLFAAGVLA
ncbi:AAA family ATPase [Streptomyces sp. NPDC091383]|uniref:methylation-associated defense system AAA family ATPase MAD3 n=1 Tax=Streptomyces sp. NPDC091383 TaxID=3365996 RepID=UPI003819BDD3